MTPRQKQVYDCIVKYWDDNGYGPSYQDIMDGVGLSSRSLVHSIVHALHNLGMIHHTPHRARSARPIEIGKASPNAKPRKEPKPKKPRKLAPDKPVRISPWD